MSREQINILNIDMSLIRAIDICLEEICFIGFSGLNGLGLGDIQVEHSMVKFLLSL